MTGKIGYVICLAALLSVSVAQASTISYALDVNGCSAGCGTPPFGSIKLDDGGGGGTVTVSVTLADQEVFAGGGAGDALAFNLKSSATPGLVITLQDPTNFQVGSADHTSAFGDFSYSVVCKTCSGGKATNPPGPLVFTVTSTPGISLTDFTLNSKNYYFSSDIAALLPGGTNTGNVGGDGLSTTAAGPGPTPEPATILLSLAGFGLTGLAKARKFLNL